MTANHAKSQLGILLSRCVRVLVALHFSVGVASAEPETPPVEDKVAGKQLYSFHARDLELKTALALFARANRLNVIPDHDVAGKVTVDFD